MSRNAEPVELLKAKGRSHHLSRAEVARRKENEVKMECGKITCPAYVKKNIDAYKKWREILPKLEGADLVRPADAGALARLCTAHAEYLHLVRLREEVAQIEPFTEEEGCEIRKELWDHSGAKEAARMWKKIAFIFSSQAILNIDKGIGQKMTSILQLEDRYFLSALSRLKNIGKKPDNVPKDEFERKGFDI